MEREEIKQKDAGFLETREDLGRPPVKIQPDCQRIQWHD